MVARRAMQGDLVAVEGDRYSLFEGSKPIIIPEEREDLGETELYRHFDAYGCLLYVGISLSAVARLVGHREDSRWFKQITRIEIERFATRKEAERAETDAIRAEKPLFNVVGAHE